MRHGLGLSALITGCVILAAAVVLNPVPAGGMDQESQLTLGGMIPMLGPEDFTPPAKVDGTAPAPALQPASFSKRISARCWMPKRKGVRLKHKSLKATHRRVAARHRIICVQPPRKAHLQKAKLKRAPAPPPVIEQADEEFDF